MFPPSACVLSHCARIQMTPCPDTRMTRARTQTVLRPNSLAP
jgi:hypothetical protein